MIKFLDLNSQYKKIKDEIDQSIKSVIENSAYIGGAYLKNFESEFANYIGVKNCVGVGNGTDALEIAIEALQLPEKSEIIVPANSFIASSEAVSRLGHKVVFADCDPASYTLSVEDVESRISRNTKALIAVHLYGHPCDMDALKDLARKQSLLIIEDCAQAHGSEYKGTKVGSIGDIATFSFYPGKNLGAYGDGGAITTNNDDLSMRCRMIANHGRIAKYDHEFEGRNSRLDGLQAAILSVKLKYLPSWVEHRIKVAEFYLEKLSTINELVLPSRHDWAKHAYHLFVLRTFKRDELRNFLAENQIQTGIHYPKALPKLQAYKYLNQFNDDTFANRSDENLLSLPIGEHLKVEELKDIVYRIEEFFSGQ